MTLSVESSSPTLLKAKSSTAVLLSACAMLTLPSIVTVPPSLMIVAS